MLYINQQNSVQIFKWFPPEFRVLGSDPETVRKIVFFPGWKTIFPSRNIDEFPNISDFRLGTSNSGFRDFFRVVPSFSLAKVFRKNGNHRYTAPSQYLVWTKVIYTSVIIRYFWTVTFEHTDLRFSAHSSLKLTSLLKLCSAQISYYGTCLYTLWFEPGNLFVQTRLSSLVVHYTDTPQLPGCTDTPQLPGCTVHCTDTPQLPGCTDTSQLPGCTDTP